MRYWLRQFASDNEYGDWVKRSIPEKLNTAKKRTTLFYYRQLAEFGESLLKARKQFASDELFGKWSEELIKNSPHRADRKSLFNYRQLAEFGKWCSALFENARHKLGK